MTPPTAFYPGSLGTEATMAYRGEQVPGLNIPEHDYIALEYTGNNPTTISYYQGGSDGRLVTRLTLTYSGNNVTSIAKDRTLS